MRKWVSWALAAVIVLGTGTAAAIFHARTPGGLTGIFTGGSERAARPAPLQAQAQQGGEVDRSNFGDWLLACPRDSEAASNCMILQNHLAGNSDRRLFLIQIRRSEEGIFEALMQTPIGVRLSPGIVLEVDGLELSRAAFSYCRPTECHARARLNPDTFLQLLEADSANARFQMYNGQNVQIALSLNGLVDAAEALR